MRRLDDVVFYDERAQLYEAFMSDVRALGGDPKSVAEVGRLLRFALESKCDRWQWTALDRRLSTLLACSAHDPHHPAVARLHSYLDENRYGV